MERLEWLTPVHFSLRMTGFSYVSKVECICSDQNMTLISTELSFIPNGHTGVQYKVLPELKVPVKLIRLIRITMQKRSAQVHEDMKPTRRIFDICLEYIIWKILANLGILLKKSSQIVSYREDINILTLLKKNAKEGLIKLDDVVKEVVLKINKEKIEIMKRKTEERRKPDKWLQLRTSQ